jgi:hypothetical protein
LYHRRVLPPPIADRLAEPPRRAWAAALAAVVFVAGLAGCDVLFRHDLPRELAGMSQTFTARQDAGLAQVRKLHGHAIDVRSGAFAIYGPGAVSLWVAGARDTAAAEGLMLAMTARIAVGDSPFRPDSVYVRAHHEVHELSGLGQRDFYFRSGRRVIWVAANRGKADAAIGEALEFYR